MIVVVVFVYFVWSVLVDIVQRSLVFIRKSCVLCRDGSVLISDWHWIVFVCDHCCRLMLVSVG